MYTCWIGIAHLPPYRQTSQRRELRCHTPMRLRSRLCCRGAGSRALERPWDHGKASWHQAGEQATISIYGLLSWSTCMYACMHVWVYVCTYVRTYVCLSVCLPACLHACMYVYVLYIYICTRITVLDIIYIYILYNKHINHKNQNTCCHPEKATTMISIRQPSINNIMLINHPEHSSA